MSISQKLEKIATQEDLFPELSAEEKEANKTVAKIVTIGDKYRAMTDEELAYCFAISTSCHRCPVQDCGGGQLNCVDIWLDWLKQEVQE